MDGEKTRSSQDPPGRAGQTRTCLHPHRLGCRGSQAPSGGRPSSASDWTRLVHWGQLPGHGQCCPAPSHTRVHTLGLIHPREGAGVGGDRWGAGSGAPGKPCHPTQRRDAPPSLVPSCSARGNTCSHFHQGMFTRRQQLYSESSRLRRRTAGPLHLRPQETPVPRAPRLCPSLPRDEEGSRNLGREGADGERRGWRGIPAPHRHAFLSHPREDGRAGGGEGGGVSPALAGTSRWRVINRCVKCRVCSGTSEPGAARIPQKGLLHPPNAGPANEPRRVGLSPQQDSEG